jgi:protein-L-isoaspartate(D-aspartate) O-methyltransferase
MQAMTERHLTILRRHMVEVIAIHAELASEEIELASGADPRLVLLR